MSYLDFLFPFHSPLQDTLHLIVKSLEVPLGCGSFSALLVYDDPDSFEEFQSGRSWVAPLLDSD